jgi:hypothetical protein
VGCLEEDFQMPRLFIAAASTALLFVIVATPVLSEGLHRRADLATPPSGHADPGDLVMDIRLTKALPNAFGAPDIFGRRRPAVSLFSTSDYRTEWLTSAVKAPPLATRTPLLIPKSSQTIINGQIGTQTFGGTLQALLNHAELLGVIGQWPPGLLCVRDLDES